MAFSRSSNVTGVSSFSKENLDNYIKVQQQHVNHGKKILNGQFNNGYMLMFGSGAVGVLWATVPVVGAPIALVSVAAGVFSNFYQDQTKDQLDAFTADTEKGLTALKAIQSDWENKKGVFSNNIVSIKLSIPISRMYDSARRQTQNFAAVAGVRVTSATTASGIVFES